MTVLQQICRFLVSENCTKKNYTVSELAVIVGATEQSVRSAVKRGMKMDVVGYEEHGSFRLYSLGKRGELVASLPMKFRTYADLTNTLEILAEREVNK